MNAIKRTGVFAVFVLGFAFTSGAAPAQNYADQLTPTPDIEKVGQRYILMVLDQPDRDLTHGRTKVNVMVDTKTGKTWILEYARKPSSNEQGYVWSEIPFAKAPGRRNRRQSMPRPAQPPGPPHTPEPRKEKPPPGTPG